MSHGGPPNAAQAALDERTIGSSATGGGELVKTCTRCSTAKPISEFSYRRTEQRYEAKCKLCRRSLRKRPDSADVGATAATGNVEAKRRRRPVGEAAPRRVEPGVAETAALVDAIDFGDLEKCGGKALDFYERHDAVQRFNEFVAILLEGYGEMVGRHVYIRKD